MNQIMQSKLESAIERAYAVGTSCTYGVPDKPDCHCPWCAGHRRRPLVVGDTVIDWVTETRATVEHVENGTVAVRGYDGIVRCYDESKSKRMPLVEWAPLLTDVWLYYGHYPSLLVLIDGDYYLVEDKTTDGILGYSIDYPFCSVAAATKWLQTEWVR